MITLIARHVIPAAYAVLPPAMASDRATRMLLAIGWQESRFTHRRQVSGPARGFWQFEQGGGVLGVLSHPSTRTIVRDALDALCYRDPPTPYGIHTALQHNDVLAAVFARLYLWTSPRSLPALEDARGAWTEYLAVWRPGRPHEATWPEAWTAAGRASAIDGDVVRAALPPRATT